MNKIIYQFSNKQLKICLNLVSKSRIDDANWSFLGKDENHVCIRNNELVLVILHKTKLETLNLAWFTHSIKYMILNKAEQLLKVLGRLLISFLKYHRLTYGVDDALLDKKTNFRREKIPKRAFGKGIQAGAQFCGIKSTFIEKDDESEDVENSSKQADKIKKAKMNHKKIDNSLRKLTKEKKNV